MEVDSVFALILRDTPPVPATLVPRIIAKIQEQPAPKTPWQKLRRLLPWGGLMIAILLAVIFRNFRPDYKISVLNEPDNVVSSHPIFDRVRNLELTPLFRTYNEINGTHPLYLDWNIVREGIKNRGVRYEGVEGLISRREVEQGRQMFRVFLDGPEKMSTYFLATEETVGQFNAAEFFGYAFQPTDPLLWPFLARLDHMSLRRPGVRDDLYTIGDYFLNKFTKVKESEIDFARGRGFRLTRNPDKDYWWVLERTFLSPILVNTAKNRFYICWSRLSTAKAYQLEVRRDLGKWKSIYKGEKNVFSFLLQIPGHYKFRVRPLLKNRESVKKDLPHHRKGLEERYSNVRAIGFPLLSRSNKMVDFQIKSTKKWQLKSALFNWRWEGWKLRNYTGKLPKNARITQKTNGTITIYDPSRTANLYIARKTAWKLPFTVQVRLKVDEIIGDEVKMLPVITCLIKDKVSIQPVLNLNGISTWHHKDFYPVDTTTFHTYTIVANTDRSADIYLDDNFGTPALHIESGETTFSPYTRLEIGSPTDAISKITIDHICYTQGKVLELACSPDWIEIEYSHEIF